VGIGRGDMNKTPISSAEDNADTFNPGGLFARKKGLRRYIGPKRIILLVIFAITVGFAWHLYHQGILTPDMLTEWISAYPLASITAFTLLYAFSVVAALPTLPFNLAAGIFWGPVLGGIVATAGSGLGAVGAFFAARILFGQPLARKFDHRIVSWLQREFDEKGWRFIAFVRINPVFPTGPINYIFGLTSVRATTYIWATVLFLFPPSLAFAILGHEIGAFVIEGESANLVHGVIAVSAAVTILVAMKFAGKYLSYRRKSQL